jgi:hypothetical protein
VLPVPSTVRALALAPPRWGDLLPWRRLTIYTTSSFDEATAELERNISRARFLGAGEDPRLPFAGRVAGARFTFRRQTVRRNSFLPIVEVVVSPLSRGARVDVQMRLQFFVLAFMAVWMMGATLGALIGLGLALFHGRPEGLVALLLPLFGGGLTGIAFADEARRAEAMLRSLFPPAPIPLPEGLPPYR